MRVPQPPTLPLSDREITTLSRLLFALPVCYSLCFRQFLLGQFLLVTMAVRRRSVGTRSHPLATRSTPYPAAGQGARSAAPQADGDSQSTSPDFCFGLWISLLHFSRAADSCCSDFAPTPFGSNLRLGDFSHICRQFRNPRHLLRHLRIRDVCRIVFRNAADTTPPSPTIVSPGPNATNPVSLPQLPAPIRLKEKS